MNRRLNLEQTFFGVENTKYVLFFVWLVLTLLNLNKAFHMDDAFHLEAAAHLRNHPLTPMSGLINWSYNLEPMSSFNQPPLYFYMLAFVTSFLGESEVGLHLFQSIFTFLTLFLFYRITDLLELKYKNAHLIFFAFCPGLIVNQNIMTDIPILSLVLGICYFLLKAKRGNEFKNYLMASLLLSIGLLIKYSLLPVVVVLLVAILLNKSYRSLVVVLIPILFLGLWSYWNYIEYNGIHLLGRPASNSGFFNSTVGILVCLGVISPFSILLFHSIPWFSNKVKRYLIYGITIVCILVPIVYFWFDIEVESVMTYTKVFMFFGATIFLFLLSEVFNKMNKNMSAFLKGDDVVFVLFFAGFGFFFFLFAPFLATRHMLLMVPFALFLTRDILDQISLKPMLSVILFAVFYGVILGVSDWKYADYYREMAAKIDLPKEAKVWSAGHWGWQHYSRKHGMIQFTTDSSKIEHGDYYVYPGNVAIQKRKGEFGLIVIDKIWKDSDVSMFISGNDFAGMYNTYPGRPPWMFSKEPVDTIYVCKVDKGEGYLVKKIKSNENWFNQVKQKALKRGVSVDTMLLMDARWILNQKK